MLWKDFHSWATRETGAQREDMRSWTLSGWPMKIQPLGMGEVAFGHAPLLWFLLQMQMKFWKIWGKYNARGTGLEIRGFGFPPGYSSCFLFLASVSLPPMRSRGVCNSTHVCRHHEWCHSPPSKLDFMISRIEWLWHLDLFNDSINTGLNYTSKFLLNRSLKYIAVSLNVWALVPHSRY